MKVPLFEIGDKVEKAIPMWLVLMLIFSAVNCHAQENEERELPYHQLGLILSHAHVFEGITEEGKKSVVSLASWGVDYNFFFHPRWGVGLHTDVILEEFKVEKVFGDKEVIKRSYPIAPAAMAIYKPFEHWSFLLGMGGEFAKEENFFLTRLGIEYGAELSERWELAGSLAYDLKWDAYDTWTIGIGIVRVFR